MEALASLGYSSKDVGSSSIVLESGGVKYFNLSDVSKVFNEFYTSVASDLVSRLPSSFSAHSHVFLMNSTGRRVVIADALC